MPAHNAYIAMLADTGIVGLASYPLLMSPAIYFVFRPIHDFPQYPQWETIVLTYILYGSCETTGVLLRKHLLDHFSVGRVQLFETHTGSIPESEISGL